MLPHDFKSDLPLPTFLSTPLFAGNFGGTTNSVAQAERQAVNSTVQGSAADLVKKAMLNIHSRLVETFPKCKIPLRETSEVVGNSKKSLSKCSYLDEGAHFILQLHDELYYEVLEANHS